MQILKTGNYTPQAAKIDGATFIGIQKVPAKPAIKHTDKVKGRKASPGYTLDFYLKGNIIFAVKEGGVVFTIHHKSITMLGFDHKKESWTYSGYLQNHMVTTIEIEVPNGHSFNAITQLLTDFHNQ